MKINGYDLKIAFYLSFHTQDDVKLENPTSSGILENPDTRYTFRENPELDGRVNTLFQCF